MSVMLPDPLEWVLEMLGFNWPTADEDKLIECAQVWRQFATEVEGHQSRGNTYASNVLGENSGDAIEGFSKAWEKFSGNSGYLHDAREAAEVLAFTFEAAAALVIGMKIAVIVQLAILAAEIIAAQAAAPFTLGLSEIGGAAATLATREMVRKILKEVAKQVLDAIMEAAKEPVISALEAMASDLIAQTVNQNFGAQNGYNVGRTLKEGQSAATDAIKNTGESLGESLRDGAGHRAGHRARGGLDHAAGRGGEHGDGGGDGGDSESSGSGRSSSSNNSGDGADGGGSSGSNSGSGDGSRSGDGGGSGSGSGADSGSGSGSGRGAGSDGGSGSGSDGGGSSRTSNDSGGGSDGGSGSTTHSPRASDHTGAAGGTDNGGGAGHDPSSSDHTSRGADPAHRVPDAQPLPPPAQRSPFDEGFQGGNDSPYGGSHTPDSGTTPDSGSAPDTSRPDSGAAGPHLTPDNTPDAARPDGDSTSTQPTPDHTPDSARPDSDQVSTHPTPDHTPDGARPDSDPVSTQPARDTTPDSARPAPDGISTQPAPDHTPDGARPAPAPDPISTQPAPDHSPDGARPDTPESPSPSASPSPTPDPVAGNPPSYNGDSHNSGGDGTHTGAGNGDNSAGGGRPSMPHVGPAPQGAPIQHTPSTGQPLQQRDPAPGDPMPTVDGTDDTTVTTQSADTLTAPPPTQHTADAGTSTPPAPHQAQPNSPQANGPMMGAIPPQGGPAPSAPPRGGTPSNSPQTGPGGNRRPDGSQAIHDATDRPRPERPAYNPRLDGPRREETSRPYNPRLDGPRRDTPTTPPGTNRRPDGSQIVHDHTQQPTPERPPHNPRLDGPLPNDTRPDGSRPDGTGPEGTHPDGTRPDGARPDGTHPDGPHPDPSGPDASRPRNDATTTDQASAPHQDTPPHPADPGYQPHPNQQPQQPNYQQQPYAQQPAPQNPYAQQPAPQNPYAQPPQQQAQTPYTPPQQAPQQTPQQPHNQQPQQQTPQPYAQQQPVHQQPQNQQHPQQAQHQQAPPPHVPQQQSNGLPADAPHSLHHIRNDLQGGPQGLLPARAIDQQLLADAVPRHPDGTPVRHPDPFQPWAQLQNDGGLVIPGRSNNCVDCSRSFLETWFGNPQVSAPRTWDTNPDGSLDRRTGERGGIHNINRWANTPLRHSGNTAEGYARVAQDLHNAGPGAGAIIVVAWQDGSSHAFNAVNHNGKVVWVDAQSGQVSDQPIHTQGVNVWHLTLDANRQPYVPQAQPQQHPQNQQNQQHNPQTQHAQQQQQQNPYAQQQQHPQYQQAPHQQPQPTPHQQQPPQQPTPYQQAPHQQQPYQQAPQQPSPYQQQPPQQAQHQQQPGPYQQPHQQQPSPYNQQHPQQPSPYQQHPQQAQQHAQQQPHQQAPQQPHPQQNPYAQQQPGPHQQPHQQQNPYAQQPHQQPGPYAQSPQPGPYAPPHQQQPGPYTQQQSQPNPYTQQQPQPNPYTQPQQQPQPHQQPQQQTPYTQQPQQQTPQQQPGPFPQPHQQQNPYTQQPQPTPQPQPQPQQPSPQQQAQPQPSPQQQAPHAQQQPPQQQAVPQQQQAPQQQPQQQAPQQPNPNPQPQPHHPPQPPPNLPSQNEPSAGEEGAATPQNNQQDVNSLGAIRNDLDQDTGGLLPPHPDDQELLENAHPRNPDGTPQQFANPFDPWGQLQNDGGNTVPGRSNNCADCSRSFLETWYGNPQVSAPRTPDTDEHGNPDTWSPENDANENQIRWSGATHTYAGAGNDPNTPARIAHDLQQAGHGAAAIVQVDWPDNGGGHAFNAVNYHGKVIWIDTQTGQVSHDPIHISQAEHVWHIPLDANRQPLHADHVVAQPDSTPAEQTDSKPEHTADPQPENTPDHTPDPQPENKPDHTPDPQPDETADGSAGDPADTPSDASDHTSGEPVNPPADQVATPPEHPPTDQQQAPTTTGERESTPDNRGADVSHHLADALRRDQNPWLYGKPPVASPDGHAPEQDSHTEESDGREPHDRDSNGRDSTDREPTDREPNQQHPTTPDRTTHNQSAPTDTPASDTPASDSAPHPRPEAPPSPAGDRHDAAHEATEQTEPKAPADPAGEPEPSVEHHDGDNDGHHNEHEASDDPAERYKAPSASDVPVDDPPHMPDAIDPGDTPDTHDLDSGVDDKSRGGLVEQIDLDDTDRVQVDSDGLITSIDGKSVKDYLQELSEARAIRHAEMRTPLEGPCSALAIDRRTGMITEGLNGALTDVIDLENLHPLLRDNYLGMANWMHPIMASENEIRMGNRLAADGTAARDENGKVIPNSEMIFTGRAYFDDPLRHAEVKAVNELLWARQRQLEKEWRDAHGDDSTPPPLSRETLNDMRFDPRWIEDKRGKGKNKGNIIHLPGQSAPACPNCNGMLRDVPSYGGRQVYSIGDYRRQDESNQIPPVTD
ncbi:hypothetical protein SU9_010315 [Streptomyces auratus AGR0001]|uniref:Tox-PL domain-containing protein n=2 Tax=Streptomyces auratus TaxID=114687 RepID=A0A8B1N7G6_9ACTN|nr:hypothetical protein SU9_010315 [Streptomyces auratus AGR0001]